MENEQNQANQSDDSSSIIAYIIGAVLVVAVVGGAWYFRAKTPTSMDQSFNGAESESVPEVPLGPTPTLGPITGLECNKQYYNPKVAFPEYYLSLEGGDLAPATTVTCAFTAVVGTRVVGQTTVSAPLEEAPARGGKSFRCSTEAMALTPNIPTDINVTITDDAARSATCSATFTLPAP